MQTRTWVFLCIAVLLGGFIWVNARFIMVAIDTQPECVDHERLNTDGAHRAARSSC